MRRGVQMTVAARACWRWRRINKTALANYYTEWFRDSSGVGFPRDLPARRRRGMLAAGPRLHGQTV